MNPEPPIEHPEHPCGASGRCGLPRWHVGPHEIPLRAPNRDETRLLREALADALAETHDHELPLHDTFRDVFLAQADALIARGWRLALLPSLATPTHPEPGLREQIEALRDQAVDRRERFVRSRDWSLADKMDGREGALNDVLALLPTTTEAPE